MSRFLVWDRRKAARKEIGSACGEPPARPFSSTLRGGGNSSAGGLAGSVSGCAVEIVSCTPAGAPARFAVSPRERQPSNKHSVAPEAENVRPIFASFPGLPDRIPAQPAPIMMWRRLLISHLPRENKVIPGRVHCHLLASVGAEAPHGPPPNTSGLRLATLRGFLRPV